jgi:hypothetical protein
MAVDPQAAAAARPRTQEESLVDSTADQSGQEATPMLED